MVNYMDSKIYTIRCRSDENLIYVGSTTQKLSQRLAKHRSDCKRGRGCSLYDYIINDDWSDFYIELYEMYPCNQKCELEKREGEVIREIGTINKCIAGRSQKEYREENAEKIKEYKKGYRQDNIDKIKEINKTYYKNNVDKINEKNKKYYEMNADIIKEKTKKYYENNADKINEKNKKYYEMNADKINERHKEKVCCDICGAFMRKDGLTRHKKSKSCLVIASKK